MINYTFRVIIEPDENGTYHGYVPCLRGCHTWGESIELTRKNLKDAIRAYISSLAADGEPIPREQGLELFETISETEIYSVKPSPRYV
ncbi:type II toxin-antitoxin system HicB family antitoxin [Patescibacteria group bacterium]|nr:type II toxin-antitoxin system HicB family antitoxin [Patescibacteria group bacterium]MBU4512524.1 type II toxin-antitoxin system HicB family antitoxin [Patescibacteria group bacterium]MCG2693497.1 type II toxin-antitoxin system HicB family antitoxin [Candidatus Parcubacteria bacterium]